VVLDATSGADLLRAMEGVDAVVNCVAGSEETIVANAKALFAAASQTGTPVVYLSSMAVYGSALGVVDEDAPLLGDVGSYSAAKVEAEALAAACTAPVTVLRPGCIYGSESPQWTLRLITLLQERRIGDLGAAGDGCTNLVHVADVAQAILAALRKQPQGIRAYNLAMPQAPDWNGYLLVLAKAIGAVPVRRVTARRLKLESKVLAIPLKIGEKLLGAKLPPAITPSLLRTFGQDLRMDSTRVTQELSMSWISLMSGVSEAVAGRNVRRS
jgi:nucleoside-diphosphate-sugar epimerase